jgi:diguanylate cyclase (GGDEF)-like protein/PAS domain S-box-containing protein
MDLSTPVEAAEASATLDEDVRAEQIRLLIENHADRYLSLLIAGIVLAVVWFVYPAWLLCVWFGLALTTALLRSWLGFRFRSAVRSPEAVRRWAVVFSLGAAASGALWGCVGSITLVTPSPALQFFSVMVAGGMMAGGVMIDAASAPAMMCFALPTVVPAILVLVTRGDLPHLGMGVLLALFSIVIISAAFKLNRGIVQNIQLRFGRDALLAKVQTSEAAMAQAQLLARNGSWDLDLATGIIRLSTEGYKVFGFSRDDDPIQFATLLARIHPDDIASVNAHVARSHIESAATGIDFRLLMPGGEIKHVNTTPSTIFGADGRARRLVGSAQDVTDRRLAEERLQFANLVLKTQMEASQHGILVVDANRHAAGFNLRFSEMWRIPTTSLVDADDDAIRAGMAALVRDPAAYLAHTKYLAEHPELIVDEEIGMADGRIFSCFSRSMQSADAQELGRVWFFGDITERRAAEAKLQFANVLLGAQMDASPDGMLVVDAEQRIIAFNRRLAEIMHIPMPDSLAEANIAMEAKMKLGIGDTRAFKERIEYIASHPDERSHDEIEDLDGRIFDRHSVSLHTEAGVYLGRAWFLSDVTERRKAEKTLQFANVMMKTQMEASPDGILVIGAGRKVLSYNQRFSDIWHVPLRLLAAGDANAVRAAMAASVKDEPSFMAMSLHAEATSDEVSADAVETRDGRFIEINSRNLRGAGESHFGRVWFHRDITAYRRAEALALHLARHDFLTGLANRAVFVEAVGRAIAGTKRSGSGLAVLYLDLDHFKNVNDTLGHAAGDALLGEVAARLGGNIREGDTVARFGGDEFAIVALGIRTPDDAAALAANLVTAINAPFVIQGNEIHTAASIGIDLYSSGSTDVETLLAHADLALYRAKAEGRGVFRFFTEVMDFQVRARTALAFELREAVARSQFFLVYQPQVTAATGCITGVEALVRWRHPTRGVLVPGYFIPVAEASGVIVSLGQFVLREACRQAKEWLDAGFGLPRLAVNVSAIQFKHPAVLEADIMAALAASGLPPRLLELELTETALMDASRDHNELLLRLRALGIKLAIDDFGTGYSSLDYLRRFPVDRLKIAQAFTKHVEFEAGDASIVRAIIGLAHDLNIGVVVEGVETQSQLELLQSWNCGEIQGYYFARPMEAKDVGALFRNGGIIHRKPQDAGAIPA